MTKKLSLCCTTWVCFKSYFNTCLQDGYTILFIADFARFPAVVFHQSDVFTLLAVVFLVGPSWTSTMVILAVITVAKFAVFLTVGRCPTLILSKFTNFLGAKIIGLAISQLVFASSLSTVLAELAAILGHPSSVFVVGTVRIS